MSGRASLIRYGTTPPARWELVAYALAATAGLILAPRAGCALFLLLSTLCLLGKELAP